MQTLALAQTATIILQVENGRGRHTSELQKEEFEMMLMVTDHSQHCYKKSNLCQFNWINMLVYIVANWYVNLLLEPPVLR